MTEDEMNISSIVEDKTSFNIIDGKFTLYLNIGQESYPALQIDFSNYFDLLKKFIAELMDSKKKEI